MLVAQCNDSFHPQIDGVVYVVDHYAQQIETRHGRSIVVTPRAPGYTDQFPYSVLRYPSLSGTGGFEYRIGNPFSWRTVKALCDRRPDLLHVHSPFASAVLARMVRKKLKIPMIVTYHSKYSLDFQRLFKRPFRTVVERFTLDNLRAADEVWAVSQGAADDMVALGYKGDYIIVENGTEYAPGKALPAQVAAAEARFGLRPGVPVLLFVGRMVWYKNIGLILDALQRLKTKGAPFQMLFVGDGGDGEAIRAKADALGLSNDVIFTGLLRERDVLRALYSRAQLFLFVSRYDNAPLVMREAAACGLPSMVLRGSSSAEIVKEGVSGFLTEEDPDALAADLYTALADSAKLAAVGAGAQEHVYLPWEKVVDQVWERYRKVQADYREKQAAGKHIWKKADR